MSSVIMKFTFESSLENGMIEKILIRISKRYSLDLGLSRDLENLYAYIRGSIEEIEKFSRDLASELPLSFYLNSLNAEIVEEFVDDLDREFLRVYLPPCPKCLREVKDKENENYYNIFHHCEVCGYDAKVEEKSFKDVFEKLAKKLKSEGKIYIQTMNGKYEITTNLEDVKEVVAVDLAAVANYFMSFEGDAKALASIEKPYVRLKTNLNFKKEYGIGIEAFDVKLPDCMVLELLCEEINSDIKLLGLKKSERSDDLEFEVNNPYKAPFVVVSDTKHHDVLLVRGDRGFLPKFEKPINSDGFYRGYKFDSKRSVLDIDNNDKKAKHLAGVFGVIKQWGLEDKNIVGFSMYKNECKVVLNSPKFGLVDYIDFDVEFSSFEEVFFKISKMNESGEKLIKNYSQKAKKEFLNALNSDTKSSLNSIAYLWGVIGVVLGFAESIDKGYEKIIEYSTSALSKKGPRIDYKMSNRKLEPLWAIRTAMSFKLAGVDNYLLSYGVVESFGEFLVNRYEELDKESKFDGALLVGDLFDGVLLNKTYTDIKKNFKVYTPRGIAMSGAIEAYGDAYLNAL